MEGCKSFSPRIISSAAGQSRKHLAFSSRIRGAGAEGTGEGQWGGAQLHSDDATMTAADYKYRTRNPRFIRPSRGPQTTEHIVEDTISLPLPASKVHCSDRRYVVHKEGLGPLSHSKLCRCISMNCCLLLGSATSRDLSKGQRSKSSGAVRFPLTAPVGGVVERWWRWPPDATELLGVGTDNYIPYRRISWPSVP